MHIAISLLHNSIVNAMHTAFVSIKTKKKKLLIKHLHAYMHVFHKILKVHIVLFTDSLYYHKFINSANVPMSACQVQVQSTAINK